MSESSNRQSDKACGNENRKPPSRDGGGDSTAGNNKTGEQAQQDAALTQQPSPGEPAGGE